MSADSLDAIAQLVAYVVGGGIFVNSLDELHIDANYFLRGAARSKDEIPPLDALRPNRGRQRIAILVPAWKEAEVIEDMLDHNLATIDYDPAYYDFFCGTYPNDAETQARIDAVSRRAPNVHKVVLPHDGPTSKGDCLNWIYDGVVREEQRRGQRFDILLMHDAEDVIHPSSLRLYDSLIPAHDFVQTPVFSLPLAAGRLVAATYIDEFAEHHLRDMPVREALGGLVPSAGVGSAFAREAFEEVTRASGKPPFDTDSLTEDYEIGLRFRLAGKRVHFARQRAPGGGAEEYVATREYFPSHFGASIRQRSRWVLGIALQTWERVGWRGSLPVLYCLWRDRKALVTNSLVLLAYALVAYAAARAGVGAATGSHWVMSDVVPDGSILEWLLAFNLTMLVWRAGMKAHFVGRLYGPRHAILSVPRLVVGNVIGIAATTRAVYQYARHRILHEPLRWLKTTHAFLDGAAVRVRRRLGESLLAERLLAPTELQEALRVQRAAGVRLGEVLAASGVVSARNVTEALASQLAWRVAEPDPQRIPSDLLEQLPEEEAERTNVLPLERSAGSVVLAVAEPLPPEARLRLESTFEARLEQRLTPAVALSRARGLAYRRLVPAGTVEGPRLGERLLERRAIEVEPLRRALEEQSETGEMLAELLVRTRRVSAERLSDALAPEGLSFRTVAPGDVDPRLLKRLGVGFCALYGLAPIAAQERNGAPIVASAHRLDPTVAGTIARRLGVEPALALAPSMEIRLAQAVAARQVAAAPGIDGAELGALAELGIPHDAGVLAAAARRAGRSPVDQLEATRLVPPYVAAVVRARALGVELISARQPPAPQAERALPPTWARAHGVRVTAMSRRGLVLACPRPRPRLARDVGALFSQSTIVWQVLSEGKEQENGHHQAA